MRIVFSAKVEDYFFELIETLYEKEYFGFKESATTYVRDLIMDIQNNLETVPKRQAPPYFNKYGKNLYYAFFRKNKQTQWVVFFSTYLDQKEEIHMIEYVTNNHSISHLL